MFGYCFHPFCVRTHYQSFITVFILFACIHIVKIWLLFFFFLRAHISSKFHYRFYSFCVRTHYQSLVTVFNLFACARIIKVSLLFLFFLRARASSRRVIALIRRWVDKSTYASFSTDGILIIGSIELKIARTHSVFLASHKLALYMNTYHCTHLK